MQSPRKAADWKEEEGEFLEKKLFLAIIEI